jgi:hypothetical protein
LLPRQAGDGVSVGHYQINFLHVCDTLDSADGVAVLGGGLKTRRFAAAVRWVLQHEFAGIGTQVKVLALDDPVYSTAS